MFQKILLEIMNESTRGIQSSQNGSPLKPGGFGPSGPVFVPHSPRQNIQPLISCSIDAIIDFSTLLPHFVSFLLIALFQTLLMSTGHEAPF